MAPRGVHLLCGIVAAMALAGCPGIPVPDGGSGGGGGSSGAWTFLVYMVADNDLEPFAAGMPATNGRPAITGDLEEMAAVGSNSGINIVAQVDRAPGYSSAAVLNVPDWETAKRLLINKGSLNQVSDLGEVNMAEASTLADFIKWGLSTYPAEKTALVLWDHGGGSLSGFGVDETSGKTMDMPSIQKGIADGLTQAGKQRFDVIGFDACLMASFEAAEALKSYGTYLIASEETEPGHGWDYNALAGVGSSTSPTDLGRKIVDGFKAQAEQWGDVADTTLAVIDLSKLGPIETALGALAQSYPNNTAIGPVVGAVGQGRTKAVKFGDNPDPSRAMNLVDLGDLFTNAQSVSGASSLASAVDQAIVYQQRGATKASAHGLSIYFPPTAQYYTPTQQKYDEVEKLTGVKGVTEWKTFLNAYYGGGASAAVPLFVQGTGHYDATNTELRIWGDLTADGVASLADAYLVYGIPDGSGGVYLFGENGAGMKTTTTVEGTWDWSILKLSQGTYYEYGYLSIRSTSANQAVAAIPLVYEYMGQQRNAIRMIVFDPSTGNTISDRTYVESTGGAMGELNPQAGSKLRAMVAQIPSPDVYQPTWIPMSSGPNEGFDATQSISIGFVFVAAANPQAIVYGALRTENAAHAGGYIYVAQVTRP